MTDHTHYLAIVGDRHIRGRRANAPLNLDPIYGQRLQFDAATQPPVLNTVVRGGTSGAIGRVVRVVSANFVDLEMWSPLLAFAPGETLTFDTGGTATCHFILVAATHPFLDQYAVQRYEAALLTPCPADGSDLPWYDRFAKVAQTITLAAGYTGSFLQGDRIATSAGGAATVLTAAAGTGGTLVLRLIRKTGTFSAGNSVTNSTRAGAASLSVVDADPVRGMWVPHYVLPNFASQGIGFEFLPWGNGTDGADSCIGPEAYLIRSAVAKWAAATSPTDRGTRLVPFASGDTQGTDDVLGGVTIQTVKCTGTFPTSWITGETVTGPGGWSAKVHGFQSSGKLLYVITPNGATLGAGTITGATSGAVATGNGAAYGWQPGSRYWNDMVAEHAACQSRPNALYSGSAAQWEGILSMVWESEVMPFATNGAAWPTQTQMVGEWVRWINALRTQKGRADLPVALWMQAEDSHSTTIVQGGVPFSRQLRAVLRQLTAELDHVTLVSSDGLRIGQASALPLSGDRVYLETDAYVELGKRAWRSLEYALVVVPEGNRRPLPLILEAGQSQLVGGIPASFIQLERDPDLLASASFPGVSTLDAAVWNFNTGTKLWETFDVAANGAHFFPVSVSTFGPVPTFGGPGTFSGVQCALALRMKRRFSETSGSAEIGFIHIPVSATSAYAGSPGAPATWDPDAGERSQFSTSCTITALSAPTRGRITALAGQFTGWVVGQQVNVAGSALGNLGSGGNNHAVGAMSQIHAVATDGSWVELLGPFVAEGPRSFTVSYGPMPLAPLVEEQVAAALDACITQLKRVPKPKLLVWANGEADLARAAQYQVALQRVLTWLREIFGMRLKGEGEVATVVVGLTPRTPLGSDADVAAVIAAQRVVVANLTNAAFVDTSKLPMEMGIGAPRVVRQQNGIHFTPRAQFMLGYLIDEAAGGLDGIPAHPDGDAAADFGVVGGSAISTLDAIDSGTDSGFTDAVGTPGTGGLIVEDGSGVDDAESFCSIEQLDAYWAKNGSPVAVTGATTAAKAEALRRATREWVEGICGGRWRGCIQHPNQRLSFPRIGCYDDEGRLVPTGTVPWQVADATAIVAGDLLAGGTILTSGFDRGAVTSETKKGVGFEKTVTYSDRQETSSVRRLRAAEALVYPLIRGASMEVTRA